MLTTFRRVIYSVIYSATNGVFLASPLTSGITLGQNFFEEKQTLSYFGM